VSILTGDQLFCLVNALQLNKNWLVKARVGSESVAAALAVRNWQTMSIMATMNISWRWVPQKQTTCCLAIKSLHGFGGACFKTKSDVACMNALHVAYWCYWKAAWQKGIQHGACSIESSRFYRKHLLS